MSSKKEPETKEEQKVMTKYDRKMEERKKKEIKDKREAKIWRITGIVLGVVIIAVIAGFITVSVLNKREAVKSPYVTIGDHAVTKLEYYYYYNTTVNSYVTTYSSILSYMGFDPEKDYNEQQYSEDLTWKDMFDQMTVSQIQQTKVLVDDAMANNFTYDDTEDYDSTASGIESGAEAAGTALGDFYKTTYGEYATESNIAPFVKEGLLASAYYDDLITKNAPTPEEVKTYYEENKQDYDKVDYRSFVFTADVAEDAAEDDITAQMQATEEKANAMMEARKAGEDFEALCLENATEEEKANYEPEDTEYSLSEGKKYSGISSSISGWLYEDNRAEGDLTVLADETNHQYTVVEFVKRYYDEADDATISNTISTDRVAEYITKLTESYPVADNKGELKYLTVDNSAETEDTTAAEDTAATEDTTTEDAAQ